MYTVFWALHTYIHGQSLSLPSKLPLNPPGSIQQKHRLPYLISFYSVLFSCKSSLHRTDRSWQSSIHISVSAFMGINCQSKQGFLTPSYQGNDVRGGHAVQYSCNYHRNFQCLLLPPCPVYFIISLLYNNLEFQTRLVIVSL